jgi:hypothetical protein|tara:strand:+ start:65 stop:1054 length:990 start_codon:yes stop_codon:yes gene_type:complete
MLNTNQIAHEGMRLKATVLILIFLLSAMPVPTVEAQIGAPDVSLECSSNDPSGTVEVEVHPGATLTGQAFCIASNPNSYQEKIDIQVQSNGLVASHPGSITLGPNSEEEFVVTVKADQNMPMSTRNLNVKATVTEAMGVPPPNTAESEVNMIVNIMQYSGLQVEAVDSLKTLQTKVDYNFEFKVYNLGNGVDKFRLAVTENSLTVLEDAGFSVSLPAVSVEVESMGPPMKVRVIMRTPTGYEDWPINSEGQHEMTFKLDFIATSDFSCRNEGNCLTETATTSITVFAEASESDKILSGSSDNQLLIYGGGGAGVILLLVLFIAMRRRNN